MGCPGANNTNFPPEHPIISFETTGARTITAPKCEMHVRSVQSRSFCSFNTFSAILLLGNVVAAESRYFIFALGLLLIWDNVNSKFAWVLARKLKNVKWKNQRLVDLEVINFAFRTLSRFLIHSRASGRRLHMFHMLG